MDIHARIQDFLQQQRVAPFAGARDTDRFNKAGIVPFVREGGTFRYYFMKPMAARPHLPPPQFQICKGTRMALKNGTWMDIKDGEIIAGKKELLAATAIREGIEELGLKLETIIALFDVGPYDFASAKNGKHKEMWLFAAELNATHNVLPTEQVAATTADRKWLDLPAFKAAGRDDHVPIMEAIEKRLSAITR